MIHTLRSALCRSVVLLPLLWLSVGCGGPEGPKVGTLVPVSGKVTFKGEPLAGATVMFNPQAGTNGTGAFGVTDAKGEYKLIHRNGKEGIEPGSYLITINKMAMPDGSPIPEGKTAADAGAVQIVPPAFSEANPENPAQQLTVSDKGGSDFNFDIPG